ncbi:MAG: rhodanese-like domain-containing protein [Pirellulaceae bacterium]
MRNRTERDGAMIEGSEYDFLGKMPQSGHSYDPNKTYVFQCKTGGRSAIATSVAQRLGAKHVVNMTGGIDAWIAAGLPVVSGRTADTAR